MRKKHQPRTVRRVGLSDKAKKTLLVTTGCLLLVMACWWAYFKFTTVPPPNIQTAAPQAVVDFLGNERGFPRMSIDDRERYLVEAYNKFCKGEARQEMSKAFAQMSSTEQQVFVDTAFEGFKVRFLEKAEEYNRLPPSQRPRFVENAIRTFESQRQSVAGYGGADNMAESFKGMVPSTTDGMTKMLVNRTNSRQRAKAQPLFDAVAARYQQMQEGNKLQ